MSNVSFVAGGGANSFGCCSYRLRLGDKNLVIDWGGGYGSMYDEPTYDGPVDWLILSHGHFDHVGMAPKFFKNHPETEAFATPGTRDLSVIGWRQTLSKAKREGKEPPFSFDDSEFLRRSIKTLPIDVELKLTDDISIYAVDSGHILGSTSLFATFEGEIFFFSSDICFRNRHLLSGAPKLALDRCKLLVRESTYVNEEFEDPDIINENLVAATRKVCDRGGKVLIPALSIDRTQHAFAILDEAGVAPLYIDGSKKATEVYMRHLGSRAWMLRNARVFEDDRDRDNVLGQKGPAVIISSSGMVIPDTPSAVWAGNLIYDENNAIFMVNHQDPSGQGYAIVNSEKGSFIRFNGSIVLRQCEVRQFNLSAHMDKGEGLALEDRLNPDVVIYTHGEDAKIEQFINEHPGRTRIKAQAGKEVEL